MAYKVLWVDDEYDTPDLQEVADKASDRNINMDTACKSAEEALAHLEHPNDFDAVILDARFFKTISNSHTSTSDLKGLRAVTKKLEQLKSEGICLPVVIFSGQTDTVKSEMFTDTYADYSVFQKGLDENKMFDAIIQSVNERIETQVKLKYAPLFDVCVPKYLFNSSDLTNRLLNYTAQIEHNDAKKTEYLNDMRKLIEEFFEKCEKVGLLPLNINSLNDKSKFLCKENMQEYIPPYVQEAIRYILRCTQEGSHYGVADSDMRNGVASFLFRSLFFSLSNVLVWWKQFIDSNPDTVALKQYVESIQLNTEPSVSITELHNTKNFSTNTIPLPYFYIVEKDSDGFYHCGPYLMSTKHGQATEGKKVIVVEEEPNNKRKSDIYPKFAKRVKDSKE